ncbi:hypothetical protein A0H81_09782 [Grifola frondosa]|uniref:C2H2-type domain-containing protein n=1 Tax=Grifola frondosa TaxID=5627 RepID=A0A1C7M0H9_GRIFR|nr:hypothetical protein A0H81_09782 [Grifola frondosa]
MPGPIIPAGGVITPDTYARNMSWVNQAKALVAQVEAKSELGLQRYLDERESLRQRVEAGREAERILAQLESSSSADPEAGPPAIYNQHYPNAVYDEGPSTARIVEVPSPVQQLPQMSPSMPLAPTSTSQPSHQRKQQYMANSSGDSIPYTSVRQAPQNLSASQSFQHTPYHRSQPPQAMGTIPRTSQAQHIYRQTVQPISQSSQQAYSQLPSPSVNMQTMPPGPNSSNYTSGTTQQQVPVPSTSSSLDGALGSAAGAKAADGITHAKVTYSSRQTDTALASASGQTTEITSRATHYEKMLFNILKALSPQTVKQILQRVSDILNQKGNRDVASTPQAQHTELFVQAVMAQIQGLSQQEVSLSMQKVITALNGFWHPNIAAQQKAAPASTTASLQTTSPATVAPSHTHGPKPTPTLPRSNSNIKSINPYLEQAKSNIMSQISSAQASAPPRISQTSFKSSYGHVPTISANENIISSGTGSSGIPLFTTPAQLAAELLKHSRVPHGANRYSMPVSREAGTHRASSDDIPRSSNAYQRVPGPSGSLRGGLQPVVSTSSPPAAAPSDTTSMASQQNVGARPRTPVNAEKTSNLWTPDKADKTRLAQDVLRSLGRPKSSRKNSTSPSPAIKKQRTDEIIEDMVEELRSPAVMELEQAQQLPVAGMLQKEVIPLDIMQNGTAYSNDVLIPEIVEVPDGQEVAAAATMPEPIVLSPPISRTASPLPSHGVIEVSDGDEAAPFTNVGQDIKISDNDVETTDAMGGNDTSDAIMNAPSRRIIMSTPDEDQVKDFYILVPPIPAWAKRAKSPYVGETSEEYREGSDDENWRQADEAQEAVRLGYIAMRELPCCWKACGAVLNSAQRLEKHVKEHAADKEEWNTFSCEWHDCTRRFSDKPKLIHHLIRHATGSLFCAYEGCDEAFSSPRELLDHHKSNKHSRDTLRKTSVPFCPVENKPVPPLPGVIPLYLASGGQVSKHPISREQHQWLGARVLENIMPFKFSGRRSNAAVPSRNSRRLAEKITNVKSDASDAETALADIRRWTDDEYLNFADGYDVSNKAAKRCSDIPSDDVTALCDGKLVIWPIDDDKREIGLEAEEESLELEYPGDDEVDRDREPPPADEVMDDTEAVLVDTRSVKPHDASEVAGNSSVAMAADDPGSYLDADGQVRSLPRWTALPSNGGEEEMVESLL